MASSCGTRPHPTGDCPAAQGGTPASVLGSRPLLPVMLMDTVNAFAPADHRPVRDVACPGKLTTAARHPAQTHGPLLCVCTELFSCDTPGPRTRLRCQPSISHSTAGALPWQVPTASARGHSSFAAAAYAKQDQEDAQEFLQYLLDHAHLVGGPASIPWVAPCLA